MKSNPATKFEGLEIFNEDHHHIQHHPVHKLNRWGRYAFIFMLVVQVGLLNYVDSSVKSANSNAGGNSEVLSATDYSPVVDSQNYEEQLFLNNELHSKNRELRTFIDYDYEEVAAEEVEGIKAQGFKAEKVSFVENFINATASLLSH